MKIAIFGGTGLVGSTLVEHAVQQGHDVTVLARDARKAARLPHAATIIAGDALDPEAVCRTLAGADAVLSALGGLRGADSLSQGTALVLDGMRAAGVRRLLVLQGMHLHVPGESRGSGQQLVRAYMHLAAREVARHSELMRDLLSSTRDVDWTLVRIPRVVTGGATGGLRIGDQRLGPWSSITRGDAADAMLQTVDDLRLVHSAPLAATHRRARGNRFADEPNIPPIGESTNGSLTIERQREWHPIER